MAATLPGVKVGPLDPDATESFGQVAQGNTARQLLRLHRQLYPPFLRRALARPIDESHTKAVRENLDEVRGHVGGLERENGDPLVPEGAELIDAAVRGDRATGQVLTFQFRQPSGRIGKSFTSYSADDLPESFESGQEYHKIREMKDRGVVAYDSEATHTELLRRQLADSRRETAALRNAREHGGDGQDVEPAEGVDTRQTDQIVAENEQLRRELEELRPRLAQIEALRSAGAGGVPTAGLADELGEGSDATVASQDPPFEGYEELKADELVSRIKAEETSDDDRRRILAYESSHANRKSVVGAAEQALDRE